jgi:hypothetical protein
MNKVTLALNAWRAYTSARKTEGSSLRGQIIGIVCVAVIVGITLFKGDLSGAEAVGIAAAVQGLDAILKYFIPDQLGGVELVAQYDSTADPLPPIELQSSPAGPVVAPRMRESPALPPAMSSTTPILPTDFFHDSFGDK